MYMYFGHVCMYAYMYMPFVHVYILLAMYLFVCFCELRIYVCRGKAKISTNDVKPNSSSSRRKSPIIATDILEPIGVVIGYVGVLVGWLTWKLTRRKIG